MSGSSWYDVRIKLTRCHVQTRTTQSLEALSSATSNTRARRALPPPLLHRSIGPTFAPSFPM